jgi:hypothetical protein
VAVLPFGRRGPEYPSSPLTVAGIYQIVNDVKARSIARRCDTGLLTADASPEADHAMEALDSALAALGVKPVPVMH